MPSIHRRISPFDSVARALASKRHFVSRVVDTRSPTKRLYRSSNLRRDSNEISTPVVKGNHGGVRSRRSGFESRQEYCKREVRGVRLVFFWLRSSSSSSLLISCEFFLSLSLSLSFSFSLSLSHCDDSLAPNNLRIELSLPEE